MTSIEIQTETKRKMEKTLELMKEELKSIRTGRATPGLVENIRVSCYGSLTPIKQLANIAAPEPQLIVISPYDPSILKDIEKAIIQSELGLATNTDGKVIRISIPPLSEDRRKKIVTQIKEMTEVTKISIRNLRREANKHIDKEEKDSQLTEDEAKKTKDHIQKLTHDNEKKLDEFLDLKTKEILTI
ncbi:MAG: ribosome recycling factor [Candidatus Brocadiaceae bacterium]|nr:ribosome recycling factor [Candidatus Brocadiaceae bacterium]